MLNDFLLSGIVFRSEYFKVIGSNVNNVFNSVRFNVGVKYLYDFYITLDNVLKKTNSDIKNMFNENFLKQAGIDGEFNFTEKEIFKMFDMYYTTGSKTKYSIYTEIHQKLKKLFEDNSLFSKIGNDTGGNNVYVPLFQFSTDVENKKFLSTFSEKVNSIFYDIASLRNCKTVTNTEESIIKVFDNIRKLFTPSDADSKSAKVINDIENKYFNDITTKLASTINSNVNKNIEMKIYGNTSSNEIFSLIDNMVSSIENICAGIKSVRSKLVTVDDTNTIDPKMMSGEMSEIYKTLYSDISKSVNELQESLIKYISSGVKTENTNANNLYKSIGYDILYIVDTYSNAVIKGIDEITRYHDYKPKEELNLEIKNKKIYNFGNVLKDYNERLKKLKSNANSKLKNSRFRIERKPLLELIKQKMVMQANEADVPNMEYSRDINITSHDIVANKVNYLIRNPDSVLIFNYNNEKYIIKQVGSNFIIYDVNNSSQTIKQYNALVSFLDKKVPTIESELVKFSDSINIDTEKNVNTKLHIFFDGAKFIDKKDNLLKNELMLDIETAIKQKESIPTESDMLSLSLYQMSDSYKKYISKDKTGATKPIFDEAGRRLGLTLIFINNAKKLINETKDKEIISSFKRFDKMLKSNNMYITDTNVQNSRYTNMAAHLIENGFNVINRIRKKANNDGKVDVFNEILENVYTKNYKVDDNSFYNLESYMKFFGVDYRVDDQQSIQVTAKANYYNIDPKTLEVKKATSKNADMAVVKKVELPANNILDFFDVETHAGRDKLNKHIRTELNKIDTFNSLINKDAKLNSILNEDLNKTIRIPSVGQAGYGLTGNRIALPYDFSNTIEYLFDTLMNNKTLDEATRNKYQTMLSYLMHFQSGSMPTVNAKKSFVTLHNDVAYVLGDVDKNTYFTSLSLYRYRDDITNMMGGIPSLDNLLSNKKAMEMFNAEWQKMVDAKNQISLLEQRYNEKIKQINIAGGVDASNELEEIQEQINNIRTTLKNSAENLLGFNKDASVSHNVITSFSEFDPDTIKNIFLRTFGIDIMVPSQDLRSEAIATVIENAPRLYSSSRSIKTAVTILENIAKNYGISSRDIRNTAESMSRVSSLSPGFSVETLRFLTKKFKENEKPMEYHHSESDVIDQIYIREALNFINGNVDYKFRNYKTGSFFNDLYNFNKDIISLINKNKKNPPMASDYLEKNAMDVTKKSVAGVIDSVLTVFNRINNKKAEEISIDELTDNKINLANKMVDAFVENNIIDDTGKEELFKLINDKIKFIKEGKGTDTKFSIELELPDTSAVKDTKTSTNYLIATNVSNRDRFDTNNINQINYIKHIGHTVAANEMLKGRLSEEEYRAFVNDINNVAEFSVKLGTLEQKAKSTTVNKLASSMTAGRGLLPVILFTGAVKFGEHIINKKREESIKKQAALQYKKQQEERNYVPNAMSHYGSMFSIANRLFYSDFGSGGKSRLKTGTGASQALLSITKSKTPYTKFAIGLKRVVDFISKSYEKHPTLYVIGGVATGAMIGVGILANYFKNHRPARREINKKYKMAQSYYGNKVEAMPHSNIRTVFNRKTFTGYGSDMEPVNVQQVASMEAGEATPPIESSNITIPNLVLAGVDKTNDIALTTEPMHELVSITNDQIEPPVAQHYNTSYPPQMPQTDKYIPIERNISSNTEYNNTVIVKSMDDNLNNLDTYNKFITPAERKTSEHRMFSLNSAHNDKDIYSPQILSSNDLSGSKLLPDYTLKDSDKYYLVNYAMHRPTPRISLSSNRLQKISSPMDISSVSNNLLIETRPQYSVQGPYNNMSSNPYPNVPRIPLFAASKWAGKQHFRYSPNYSWIRL